MKKMKNKLDNMFKNDFIRLARLCDPKYKK